MQSRPVQGTGLEESPQGLLVEVPVGTPEGVVFAPGLVGVLVTVQAATWQRAAQAGSGLFRGRHLPHSQMEDITHKSVR